MKSSLLLKGFYICWLLMPLACFGQQCDTSAFTYNPSTGGYYMPSGFSSATSASQCSCLQQQWNAITQQIQAEHQKCLDANQGQPTRPSGNTPGSQCSIANCQSLHDALFTTIAPEQQEQMDACNNAVTQYQATVQAQQAAQQAAQQQQQAVALAAQQLRAAQIQLINQRIAASVKTQQEAAQLMAALLQQLQNLQGNQGATFTQPNWQGAGVNTLDYNNTASLPANSPGVSTQDFPGAPSNGSQNPGASGGPAQGGDPGSPVDQGANGNATTAAASNGSGTGQASDPNAASSLPGAGSTAAAAGDSFGGNSGTEAKLEPLKTAVEIGETAIDPFLKATQSALANPANTPVMNQQYQAEIEDFEGLKALLTNFKYGIDTVNMVGDVASGKGPGDAFQTLSGDALQAEIGEFLEGTFLKGAPGAALIAFFNSTATAPESMDNPQGVIGNPNVNFQDQASALHWLYSVQFDQNQASSSNPVTIASDQAFVMQQTNNFMNSGQFTLNEKKQAFGYLLREYYGHQSLWSPQQVQQLQQYFVELYQTPAGSQTLF